MTDRTMRDLGVLIVGLGSAGRRHFQSLRSLGVTHISAARTRFGSLKSDEGLEDIAIASSLEEGLAGKPDVVFVTNPTSLHLETTRLALEAGSHVFVEKPISHRSEDVTELLDLASRKGLRIGVGYDMRFNVALQGMKAAIDEGRLGRLLSAQIEVGSYLPSWHSWEDYRTSYAARSEMGGGVMLTLSHEVDLARWLMGEVIAVSAEIDRLSSLELNCEDVAALLLRFENGAVGTIHFDYLQSPPQRRCRVVGERGSLEWSPQWRATKLATSEATETIAVEGDEGLAYVDEIRDFLSAVVAGRKPERIADGRDGERAVAIIEAARESSRTGRRIMVSPQMEAAG